VSVDVFAGLLVAVGNGLEVWVKVLLGPGLEVQDKVTVGLGMGLGVLDCVAEGSTVSATVAVDDSRTVWLGVGKGSGESPKVGLALGEGLKVGLPGGQR
jgi:hypothetical protein